MSTKTEAAETKAAKRRLSAKGSSLAANLIAGLVVLAGFSWLGGVALNRGFGIHVPFVATWIALFVGVGIVKTVASQVASTWHTARVEADINLIAASLAAQEAIQQKQSGGLAGLADLLAKAGTDDHKDSGAYL